MQLAGRMEEVDKEPRDAIALNYMFSLLPSSCDIEKGKLTAVSRSIRATAARLETSVVVTCLASHQSVCECKYGEMQP